MAEPRAYILSRKTMERVNRSVRQAEAVHGPKGASRAAPPALAVSPTVGWVRLSGTTITDGRYPGHWYSFDPSDNSLNQEDVIWVRDVPGGKLYTVDGAGNPVYYAARFEGYAPDNTAVWATVDRLGGASAITGPATVTTETATTNAAVNVLTLAVDSTGTPANGLGATITTTLDTSTQEDKTASEVKTTWVNATEGSQVSQLTVNVYNVTTAVPALVLTPTLTTVTAITTATNAPATALTVKLDSTGTPAAGFGVKQVFSVETATPGTFADAGTVTASYTTATAGAEVSQLLFTVLSAGAANVPLTLQPNAVLFGGGATATQARFLEPSGGGTAYVGLQAPALAATTAYTLPNAFPAADTGYFLTADTSGVMAWATGAAGISGSLADDQVAFGNGADTIAGDADFTFNGNTLDVGNGAALPVLTLDSQGVMTAEFCDSGGDWNAIFTTFDAPTVHLGEMTSTRRGLLIEGSDAVVELVEESTDIAIRCDGDVLLCDGLGDFGVFGVGPASRQTVSGTLTGGTLGQTQAVLQSLIDAMEAYGWVIDGTT